MDRGPNVPELRKGERFTGLTPQMKRRLYWMTAFVSLLIYLGITLSIMLDNNPAAVRVKGTVYGDRPLGLPWQVVHVITFTLLCAPFPVWLVSWIRIGFLSKELERPVDGMIAFLWYYHALSANSEIRPHLRRVAYISLGYFVLFVGWLVYTSIMEI